MNSTSLKKILPTPYHLRPIPFFNQELNHELIRGESKTVEFKEMLPPNSEKYTKTIVAFANTQGGKIIFGVVDETREIIEQMNEQGA